MIRFYCKLSTVNCKLLQCFIDLSSQLFENRIVRGCIVLSFCPLVHECYVYEGHEGDGMIPLFSLEDLGISVVAVGNEFGGSAIIDLVFPVDCHFYLLVIDVQPYM